MCRDAARKHHAGIWVSLCQREVPIRYFSTWSDHQKSPFSTNELHRKYVLEIDSMDDICRKHMDLPAQEFAMGCSFLHQVALGIPPDELANILNDRPSLISFRDYDRRTALHSK